MFRLFSRVSKNKKYYELPVKIHNLEKARLSDPIKELARLKNYPSIKHRLENLDRHFTQVIPALGFRFTPYHQMAYGRVLEIQEHYKETHYTFSHGQSGTGFLLLNLLNTLLLKHRSSYSFSPFEIILRNSIELESHTHPVEWYKQYIILNDKLSAECVDHALTTSLISADGYLANTRLSESALTFFLRSSYRQVHLIEQSIMNIAKHYIDEDLREKFLDDFKKLNEEIISLIPDSGILYSICVAKDYFKECGYLSGPGGIPIDIENEEITTTLEKIQGEERVYNFSPFSEKTLDTLKTPQVRLLAHKLAPEKVNVFLFPAMPDEEFRQIVKLAQQFFESYQKYYRFPLTTEAQPPSLPQASI